MDIFYVLWRNYLYVYVFLIKIIYYFDFWDNLDCRISYDDRF